MGVDLPAPAILTVYGAAWCSDCHRTRRFLDGKSVPYRYIDLERDLAAKAMLEAAGYFAIPVVVTPGGQILIEPSDLALGTAIQSEAA